MTELFHHIWASTKGKLALIFIICIILMGLGADKIAYEGGIIPFGPTTVSSTALSYQPPGYKEFHGSTQVVTHLLGTDQIGRDVASRLIHGINTALIVGFGSTLISVIIALLLGCCAGYYGDHELTINPWLALISLILFIVGINSMHQLAYVYDINQVLYFDPVRFLLLTSVLMLIIGMFWFLLARYATSTLRLPLDSMIVRLLEVFKSIPALFLLLSVYAIITRPSLWLVVLLIGLLRWPSKTRLIRAEVLRLKEEGFVHSARFIGLPAPLIILRHILPNVIGPIVVAICFSISTAILIESTLSFLQIGLPASEVSWGQMLSESRNYFNAYWLAVPPGVLIFAMILSFNLLGQLTEVYFAQKRR